MQEQESAASTWIKSNPQFYVCDENIKAFQDLMGGLNWPVTFRNMGIAYTALLEQGALIDKPAEVEPEFRTGPEPQQQPREVFVPQSAPQAPKAAPAPAVRPVSRKPLNSSGGDFRATRKNETGPAKPTPMTAAEYAGLTSAILKQRYNKEPEFKARVDAYWAAGGR
jgi:hypothetical protein